MNSSLASDRHGGLVVRASAYRMGGRGFDPKTFKTGSNGFPLPFPPPPPPPPLAPRIMGISLQLACQCHANGLVKHWSKTVQETGICELSPLKNTEILLIQCKTPNKQTIGLLDTTEVILKKAFSTKDTMV